MSEIIDMLGDLGRYEFGVDDLTRLLSLFYSIDFRDGVNVLLDQKAKNKRKKREKK